MKWPETVKVALNRKFRSESGLLTSIFGMSLNKRIKMPCLLGSLSCVSQALIVVILFLAPYLCTINGQAARALIATIKIVKSITTSAKFCENDSMCGKMHPKRRIPKNVKMTSDFSRV